MPHLILTCSFGFEFICLVNYSIYLPLDTEIIFHIFIKFLIKALSVLVVCSFNHSSIHVGQQVIDLPVVSPVMHRFVCLVLQSEAAVLSTNWCSTSLVFVPVPFCSSLRYWSLCLLIYSSFHVVHRQVIGCWMVSTLSKGSSWSELSTTLGGFFPCYWFMCASRLHGELTFSLTLRCGSYHT